MIFFLLIQHSFQVAYGISTAADIAYLTNVYYMVDAEQYSRLTSLLQAAVLAGQTISAILAQALVSGAGVCFILARYFLSPNSFFHRSRI